MARAKSAVLSPADKKAVIADLKAKIKEGKTVLKNALTNVKNFQKEVAASQKNADKQATAVAKLEAELAAIQAG